MAPTSNSLTNMRHVGSVNEVLQLGRGSHLSNGPDDAVSLLDANKGAFQIFRVKEGVDSNDAVVVSQLITQGASLRQYVDDNQLTIAADSTDLLEINGGELSVKALTTTEVYVDTVSADLAAFVAAGSVAPQRGDVVVLQVPGETYIHKGTSTGSVDDYVVVKVPDLSESAVRAMMNAGDAILYSSSTGTFSVAVDDDTIEVYTDGDGQTRLRIKDDAIGVSKLNLGAAAGQLNASVIPLSSASSLSYSDVEAALEAIDADAKAANQKAANLTASLGISEGDTTMGSFGAEASEILAGGLDAKAAIDAVAVHSLDVKDQLETEVNNLNTSIADESSARAIAVTAETNAREAAINGVNTEIAKRASFLKVEFEYSDLVNGKASLGVMPTGAWAKRVYSACSTAWEDGIEFSVGSDANPTLLAQNSMFEATNTDELSEFSSPLIAGSGQEIFVHVTGTPTQGRMKVLVEYA